MEAQRKRSISEVLKRGYSDEEISHIYELARFYLENGALKPAAAIFLGLTKVAPDFIPAWLGLSYISFSNKVFDEALRLVEQAMKINAQSEITILYFITCLLVVGDYNAAGTYLGEIGEKIEAGLVADPKLIRFYKIQLARYQVESKKN